MTRTQVLFALVVAAAVRAQNVCVPNATLTLYGLTGQNAVVNATSAICKDYFTTNGACVAPANIASFMDTQNDWLATKAWDARNYSLQYINATVYWQTKNGHVKSTDNPSTNTSWWSKITSTLSSWWNTISNRATALFASASAWLQGVFNNTNISIPGCLQSWAELSNGAACLTASSSNIANKMDASSNNDLSWAADLSTTGAALKNCESLIENYCQLSYGVSIYNTSMPFNVTFAWGDGAIPIETCANIRAQKVCAGNDANACTNALYTQYMALFESNWIRFVPSSAAITNFGTFLAKTDTTTTTYTATTASNNGKKSLRVHVDGTGKSANVVSIGQNSGQAKRNYDAAGKSAAKLIAFTVLLLLGLIF